MNTAQKILLSVIGLLVGTVIIALFIFEYPSKQAPQATRATENADQTFTASLITKASPYFTERNACIEREIKDGENISDAEYKCSTIDLADKYYATDPDGIIALAFLTEKVSFFDGEYILSGWQQKDLDEYQLSGLLPGYYFNAQGIGQIREDAYEDMHEFLQAVIELNQAF